jgi:peroxiredoxin
MMQLREFARHEGDFNQLDTRIVAISVDDVEHNRNVWEKVARKQFPVLSDSGAVVIRKYGLLHPAGKSDTDIALRTTLLIGPQGIEQWRRVSETVPDIPKADEILTRIRANH